MEFHVSWTGPRCLQCLKRRTIVRSNLQHCKLIVRILGILMVVVSGRTTGDTPLVSGLLANHLFCQDKVDRDEDPAPIDAEKM